MIDFRYHVASLAAVFLALALGIVIGATALRGPTYNILSRASKAEIRYNAALRNTNNRDKAQISADNAFGQADSTYLLGHLLQGEHVVLVTAPGADSGTITGLTSALQQAGATLTGQVTLTQQFFGTSAATDHSLASLTTSLTPAGVSLGGTGPVTGQQAAAKLIALALMTKDGQAGLTSAQSQNIVAGFGQQGFLAVSGPGNSANLAGQATLAVVIIPASPPGDAANAALVTVAQDLNAAGHGTVLAGSTPASGSSGGTAIGLVTGNSGLALSTVDDADTVIGQIVVVQELSNLLNHQTTSNYGVGGGAAPSPAPSTSPTPLQSSSPPPHPARSHR